MRRQRWEANGGDPDSEPTSQTVASNDVDEDFIEAAADPEKATPFGTAPAQGGGSTKQYDDEPGNISSGPAIEGPDFGDEDSLNSLQTTMVVDPNADPNGNSPGPLVSAVRGTGGVAK